jgi:hypothetical protein
MKGRVCSEKKEFVTEKTSLQHKRDYAADVVTIAATS